MSGSSSTLGQPGDEGDPEAAEDEHDRRRHLAELGEADQQRRRQQQDQYRLDVVPRAAYHRTPWPNALLPRRWRTPITSAASAARSWSWCMFGDFQCPFCLGAQVGPAAGPRPPRRPPRLRLPPPADPRAPPAGADGGARRARRRPRRASSGSTTTPSSRHSRSSRARRCCAVGGTSASTPSGWRPRSTPASTGRGSTRDVASAEASGATGTPTFFVNGNHHFGAYDASSLVEALEG